MKATALGSEPSVFGQLHAIEAQHADRQGALDHLALLRADLDARQVALDQERAHAAPAGGRVGARQHDHEVADRRVVDPVWRHRIASRAPARVAVVRIAATSEPASGLGDRVGAAPLPPAAAARDRRGLLLGAAVLGEQRADQLDQTALIGDGGVAARQLLHHQGIGERISAGAARPRGP